VKGNDIYYGLGAIKGIGESAINAIFEAREKIPNKTFSSLEEFFNKVDIKKLNKKVIEALIKAGALDGFNAHRAQVAAGYQKYMDRAEENRRNQEVGQASLFDLGPASESAVVLEDVKEWPRPLALSYEKETLGFYLSDHPLAGYEQIASIWTSGFVTDLPRIFAEHKAKPVNENDKQKYDFRNRDGNRKRVVVAGIIAESRELITKKGTRMAFAKLEDLTGAVELVIFPDTFAQVQGLLKEERPVLAGGFLDGDEGTVKIIVDNMIPLEEALRKSKKMILHLHRLEEKDYQVLDSLLRDHPGQTKVEMVLEIPDLDQEVRIEPQEISGVAVSNEFLESLRSQFGSTDFVEMKL